MHYYQAFGLKIQSEFPCSFLIPSETTEPNDIYIRYGQVPPTFPNVKLNISRYQIQNSQILIHIYNVARFLIENGNTITVETFCDDNSYICLFLLGPATSALLNQRNCFIVRATCMAKKDKAILFCVDNAEALEVTTTLIKEGYQLLSDGFSVLEMHEDRVMINPGYPLLKLNDEISTLFGVDKNQFHTIGHRTNKYYVPITDYFCSKPLPLSQIMLLIKSENKATEYLSGATRLTAFLSMAPTSIFVPLLNKIESNFLNRVKLMNKNLTVSRVYYSDAPALIRVFNHA